MAIIDTLRPTATISSLDWTTVPVTGATAHGVTSDNSDATYVVGSFDGATLVLSVGSHGVPVGHRRHLARVRARGRNGRVSASIRVPTGANIALSSLDFGDTGSFTTVNGSYAGGLPPTAAGSFSINVDGEDASVDVAELYVDIDSRAQPTYDPQISDGASITTTITATSAPTVELINVDTDALPVARWRAWITPQGSTMITWDTGSVAGSPLPRQTTPLVNGSYTLHVQLWSTLGDGSEYAGVEETLDFTINLVPVIPPEALSVAAVAGTPFFEITVETPASLADYDTNPYIEFQRSDCGGSASEIWTTIALIGPAAPTGVGTHIDWTAPRTYGIADCVTVTPCEFEYRARFVGTVGGQLATSEWVYETDATGNIAWRFTGNSLNPTVEVNLTGTPVSGFGLPSIATQSPGYTTDPVLNTGMMAASSFNASQYLYATVTGTGLGQLRRMRLKASKTNASTERGFHVRTSADNFSADQYASTVTSQRTAWTQYDISLNVPVTGSAITLHLHTYAVTGGELDIDDIELYFGNPVTHSLVWTDDNILLRTRDTDGPHWFSACGTAEWDVDKPFTARLGIMGGQQVTSGSPALHDLTLNIGIESQEDLELLEYILGRQLVLVSPADSAEQWSAPSNVGVDILTIRGVRTVAVTMIGTGPEPAHEPDEVLE